MSRANFLERWFGLIFCVAASSCAAANYDGSFDPAWAGGGRIAFSNGGATSPVFDVIVQSSGNVLLGGSVNPGGSSGTEWLADLTPGGQFVLTFGQSNGSGKTTLCTAAGSPFCGGTASWRQLKTQADGKILLLTHTQLARLSPTASALDTAGTAGGLGYASLVGISITNVGGTFSAPYAFVMQPDGKVLVAGAGRYTGVSTQDDFALLRLNSDLSLDTTFNASTDGNGATFAGGQTVAFDLGGDNIDTAAAVSLRADGRIVLIGTADTTAASAIAIACLTASGAIDTSCGAGTGKSSLQWAGGAFQLDDDNLIAESREIALDRVGRVTVVATATPAAQSTTGFIAVRTNPDGSVDSSFGSGGFSYAGNFAACGTGVIAHAMSFDSAGRILIAGRCKNMGSNEFAISRLRGDTGTLDTSFGIAGLSHGSFASTSSGDEAYVIALEPGGRPVIGGLTLSGNGSAGVGRLTYDLIFTEPFEAAPAGCLAPNCH